MTSLFKYYPAQRSTVLDELVTGVTAHLAAVGGKDTHLARHYPLQVGNPLEAGLLSGGEVDCGCPGRCCVLRLLGGRE